MLVVLAQALYQQNRSHYSRRFDLVLTTKELTFFPKECFHQSDQPEFQLVSSSFYPTYVPTLNSTKGPSPL